MKKNQLLEILKINIIKKKKQKNKKKINTKINKNLNKELVNFKPKTEGRESGVLLFI
jgi:hypothetical protein